MKKYQTQFKPKVVKSFLLETAEQSCWRGSGRCLEEVRTWVSHYRMHGIDGLRPNAALLCAELPAAANGLQPMLCATTSAGI